ncbi:MAG: sigma-54-dependent Fis family transcriptional regulator [Rhodopirellula sp.]|nr:sigma-54-dependent Fis family transcriptional regulator [Rhodopirellula sp.]
MQTIQPQTKPSDCNSMIGCSEAMLDIFDQIGRVAATDATVLILGESGTGKELVARAIHDRSNRSEGPYSAINMAAVPKTLVESELFGHTKGSFTGAGTDRPGRFEACHGGTLFIDEIGDLELTSQAKLLRVLEDHRITPIGSNDGKQVDVRVLAATSRNLDQMIGDGSFREDLYYRLNVVALRIPPLRQRQGDIPLLARHFLEMSCWTNHRELLGPDAELWRFLQNYQWPGNVRQLRNCIESMVVLAKGPTLTIDDLPAMVRRAPDASRSFFEIPEGYTLADIERVVVGQTLRHFSGRRTEAAESLGISIRTLQRKLKRWETDDAGLNLSEGVYCASDRYAFATSG